MVPISGSAYTYSYATLGELVAWVIGWDLIIEYAVGNIGVAISWGNYFKTFVEGFEIKGYVIRIPDWLSMDYRTAVRYAEKHADFWNHVPHVFGVPIIFNLLAVSIVVLITFVLLWGVRESARFNAVMVCIKILVLTFFIVVGAMWFQPGNWTPLAPNGWGGISAGAAVVFFAYIGFDAVSTVAEETRNPKRDLPIGIIASLVICTIFYIAVAVIFTGLIPYDALKAKLANEQAEPLTMALEYAVTDPHWLNWSKGIVAFGSVIAHTAVLLVYQLGQPRIFFAMSRDGLLPPVFAQVHRRFRTPWFSTIVTGIFVAVVAAFANIEEMVDLTNIGTLFAFILVCAGIIVLRAKDPHRPRPFRVPGGWLLPALGIASCLYLIYYLPTTSWLRFAAWLNFGFVVYVGYGAVHSRLTGRQRGDVTAEHDAQTARVGAWLAVVGVGMLLLMHVLEVWLEGHLSEIFTPATWLGLSWFLIIPLAINAFILCPIILRRAWCVRRSGAADSRRGTAASMAVAVVLMVLTAAYFGLLLREHLSA
jgi:APA family basic amino acid/polyamine antiporter